MDRDNLEIDQVMPVSDPLLEEAHVIALHQLKTPLVVLFHPAIDVFQPFRQHASLLSKPAIDRCGVVIPKPFDHHVEHRESSSYPADPLPSLSPAMSRRIAWTSASQPLN